MIVDATCAPSNIRYPQDVSLLNEARENAEKLLDVLHDPADGKKPRTYRKRARKDYLKYTRCRKHTAKMTRKAIGKQLAYLRRNLDAVDGKLSLGKSLTTRQMERLDTIRTIYEQQKYMYDNRTHSVGQADQAYLRRLLVQMAGSSLLTFSPAADLNKAIAQLRRYRGAAFEESDLELLLHRVSAAKTDRKPLETADLMMRPCRAQRAQGREALQAMVGLSGVKDALSRILAVTAMEDRRRLSGVEIAPSCRNMAFSGAPGTGKSVTARLAAQILREEGCGTGRFVEAGREQLIGAYLGQTSHMIAELFQQARGGVLFIDEAGTLLNNDGQDIYVTEAVNALVRHMELEPEAMVIFATYSDEMKKLLASNPGLSSRVAQVLEFPGYEDGQLFDIFKTFADKERLTLPDDAADICSHFFTPLRRRKGENFGNGREARRLFQAAKEEMALRVMGQPEVGSALTSADLEAAASRLLAQETKDSQTSIGFHR